MYTLSSSLRRTKTKDGAIVLDVRGGRVFRLNPTADQILEHLQQGRNEAETALAISEMFHILPELAYRDISDFVKILEVNGLVDHTPDSNSEKHYEV